MDSISVIRGGPLDSNMIKLGNFQLAWPQLGSQLSQNSAWAKATTAFIFMCVCLCVCLCVCSCLNAGLTAPRINLIFGIHTHIGSDCAIAYMILTFGIIKGHFRSKNL